MKVSIALLSCVDGPAEPVCAYEPSHELALVVDGPAHVSAKISTLSSLEAAAGLAFAGAPRSLRHVIEVALPSRAPEGASGRRPIRTPGDATLILDSHAP